MTDAGRLTDDQRAKVDAVSRDLAAGGFTVEEASERLGAAIKAGIRELRSVPRMVETMGRVIAEHDSVREPE